MNTQNLPIAENTPQSQKWSNTVGGFFQGFGTIELITTEFIKRMAAPFKYKSMKKKFLSQKLSWIIDNLSDRSNAGRETRLETIGILEEIRELSYFRNILAHAAMGFSPNEDSGNDESGKPTPAGILNFKPDDDEEDSEFTSLEDIQEKSDDLAVLAKRLLDLLNGMELTREDPAP
jgi:hypothetical protein